MDRGLNILDRPRIHAFFKKHEQHPVLCEGALDLLEAHCLAVERHLASSDLGLDQRAEERSSAEVIAFIRGLEARQEARLSQSAHTARGEIADKLMTLMGSVDNAIRASLSKVDATSVSERVSEVLREGMGELRTEFMGEMRRLDRGQTEGSACLSATLNALQRGSDEVSSRVERLQETVVVAQARQSSSQCVKGKAGEHRLVDLLGERLTSREDFQVDLVCGQAHQCDISIKRLGHPEVRVECKAHGEQTGEKVRARETARFQSDLVGLKLSGIFVSLHASIVGKPDLAIEMLPTGKFAVYLGNNQYDVGVIECMLHLVYRLEAATVTTLDGRAGAGTVSVTPEAMQRVQLMLKSCGDKVHAIKVHLRSALTILTDMTFDMISRTLLGDEVTTQALAPTRVGLPQSHGCSECEMSYKTAAGLLSHVRAKHAVKA